MSHLNESVLKKIEDIAFIAKNDINRAANLLRDLIQIHTKYDTVIVALTEISTILSAHKKLLKILGKNKIVVDSLGLLAEEVAKTYVNGIFDTLFVDRNKESIKIELLNADEKVKVKSEIWNILCEINYEFTPPLSSRYSTTTAFSSEVIELAESVEDDKPKAYFDTFIKQEIIVSKKESNNRITGFMSYIPFHKIHINEKDIICHYITTIGVTKGERGNGITGLFYKRIEEIAKKDGANIITTRTWNTNQTHIKIASDFGYERHVIKNDRGPGIDTVYLIKDITK
jgi:GNAT superfamily N-acetyltransferase